MTPTLRNYAKRTAEEMGESLAEAVRNMRDNAGAVAVEVGCTPEAVVAWCAESQTVIVLPQAHLGDMGPLARAEDPDAFDEHAIRAVRAAYPAATVYFSAKCDDEDDVLVCTDMTDWVLADRIREAVRDILREVWARGEFWTAESV